MSAFFNAIQSHHSRDGCDRQHKFAPGNAPQADTVSSLACSPARPRLKSHKRSADGVLVRPPLQGNEIRPSASISAAAAGRRAMFASFIALVELRQVAGDDRAVHRPGITTADEWGALLYVQLRGLRSKVYKPASHHALGARVVLVVLLLAPSGSSLQGINMSAKGCGA